MVKFGKNKLKALNKIAKNQKLVTTSPGVSNKIIKRKINADKKVTFQKKILLNNSVAGDNALVKSVTANEVILNETKKKIEKKKSAKCLQQNLEKPKLKPVEKHKKRQKTQLSDTKLLLSIMKKK